MNLADQLEWEEELINRGADTYWANQDRLRANGDGDKADTVSYLLQERMQEVANVIEARTNNYVGRGARFTRPFKQVAQGDYLKLAYIGLQVIFQKTSMKGHNTTAKICLGIGSRLEADLKCQMFEAKNPAYYATVLKSLKEQKVTDYTHKHKVLMKKFRDFDNLEWEDFEPNVLAQFGLRVLDAILQVFSDVFFSHLVRTNGKTTSVVDTTVEFDEWQGDFERARGLLHPLRLPLKIPPRAWDRNMQGGYYTPTLSQTTTFIKTKSRDHKKFVEANVPLEHLKAVNAMQRTPWKINTRVLDVQQEIYTKGLGIGIPSNKKLVPIPFPAHIAGIDPKLQNAEQKEEVLAWKIRAKATYGNEQTRKAKVIAFMQAFKLAQEIRHWDKLYYVYTCDFRGRIYCATAGLSPQGADTAKGLLMFAKSEPLGDSGIRWLAVQGANVFGKDKLAYDARVQWVREQENFIRQVVEDPINYRDFWGAADKPYQFLAFCFEWADCDFGRNPHAHSSIPVGLDGSCNGLQHFSAMLRDEVGAKAVNLSHSELPQDIYQEVANTTAKNIAEIDHPCAHAWLDVGLTRKVAKQPVMTLPYGAKQKSARASIFAWALDNWKLFKLDDKHTWEYSKWLTPHLWEAIGSTVVAARAAMDWLQKNVGSDYCSWLTPIGFPVYQYYKSVPTTRVSTQLCGVKELYLDDLDCYGDPKTSQQRSGIAPNFVHSIDSTHMVMTINLTDFSCYAMIHDDFGTHAGKTDVLFKAIRTSFYTLYTQHSPLNDWAEQTGADVKTMPETGMYDIEDIKNAPYFFG